MKEKNTLHLPCSCNAHMLAITKDEEDAMWYFCYWKMGHDVGKLPWIQRIRLAWQIFRTGTPYADDIVFEKKELEILKSYLTKQLKECGDEKIVTHTD